MELLQRKFHGVKYNIGYSKHQAEDFRRWNCVLCIRFFQAPTKQNSECNRQIFLNNTVCSKHNGWYTQVYVF